MLIDRLDRHYVAMREVTYMNIVVPVLLQVYEGLLRRMLKSRGIAIEMLDFTEGQSDFANYDPNIHLEALHRQFEALAPELQRQVLNGGSDASPAVDGLAELQLSVDAFMEQFGHLADSGNDFSCPRWSENREMILNLIADYTEPEMVSERSTWAELPLGRLDKLWLGWIYRRARQFRLYREGVSSLYTYAHAELRKYWLEIGARLVKRELIDHAQDVFLLKEPDIREAMTVSDSQSKLRKHIADRKQAMERAKEFVLPEVIFGDEMPPPETLDHSMDTLHGIPTARGYYTGTARVIRGIREFDRLTPGEVLVVPFSDVGWTPLFSKAGAVIAESGGMLSHSSIVAREYGLPAVVSVSSACDLLEGKQVTVDGYKGEVRVHREGS